MSIRLKKVEWEESFDSYYTEIGGVHYAVKEWGEYWLTSLGCYFPDSLSAKAACEQHALERIREAVEVVSDHIPDATKMVNSDHLRDATKMIEPK